MYFPNRSSIKATICRASAGSIIAPNRTVDAPLSNANFLTVSFQQGINSLAQVLQRFFLRRPRSNCVQLVASCYDAFVGVFQSDQQLVAHIWHHPGYANPHNDKFAAKNVQVTTVQGRQSIFAHSSRTEVLSHRLNESVHLGFSPLFRHGEKPTAAEFRVIALQRKPPEETFTDERLVERLGVNG